MKNNFKLGLSFICAILLLSSCEKSENLQDAETIGLEMQQENEFSGKTKIKGHTLVYSVDAVKELHFRTVVKIDDYVLSAIVKYDNESIDFDAENLVLTGEQKEVLLMLGQQISGYLFESKSTEDFAMGEYTLLRLLEYWAKSPVGYSYQKRTASSKKTMGNGLKSRNEGITCIRRNTFVTAEYDDASGRNYRDRKLVNGDRCLGRCGSGCPGIFTIASAWTKDCLDHDQCGRVLGGSTNPVDRNCGDEFREAADDYLFGVIRGCRG